MAIITGEQKTWHKITLDFETPQNFNETPSTFRDYRLDVTFANADTGEVITLPGFFAADGDAANTNATSGNVWRVNFNAPSEGDWTYEASFRTGDDIAAQTYEQAPNAGQSAGGIDGETGSISVSETDKTGEDFRAKGMIIQDEGTHFLQHQGDQDYFVRGGPGIPENFLANTDFDNTANGRHDYASHLDDYNAGDPTWDGGKGKAIIGASNYLAEQGLNTIYLLTNTSGGDGQDVSPWTFAAQDTAKNDRGLSNNEIDKFSTYDVSKLAQWDIVFDHLDDNGIYKNVLLQETENDQQLDGGTNVDGSSLSVERLVYIREMVARFGHNNGLQWNIGEENTNTDQQRADQAEYLKSVDGYDHLVVIHSYPGQIDQVYNPLLNTEEFDGASFQTSAQSIREKTIEFRDKSAESGDKWVLAWDEDSSSNGIVDPYSNDPDSNNEVTLREGYWGMLTAGGSGGNWYFKGSSGHSLDQNYDTFEAHESVWTWTAAATSFFNTYIPFWDMRQADGLTSDNDDFVMAKDGEYYVVYAPYGEAGNIRLDLDGQGGETFDVFWYNPRTGGELIEDGQISGGGVRVIGNAPSENQKDWVLLVRNQDVPEFPTLPSGETPQPPVTPEPIGDAYFEMNDGRVVIQAEDGTFVNEDSAANDTWQLTDQFDGSKGDGALLWTGNDYFANNNAGTAKTAPLAYKFEVTEPGTYYLSLRATRPVTGEESDRNNDFFVQFEDQGFTKIFFSGARDAFNWATTFDAGHTKSPATFDVTQDMIDANNGVFTLTLSARSHQAAVDEIHIQKGSFSRDHDAPTSQLVDGGAPVVPTPSPVDNDAPVAVDDVASTDQNKTILVDVLGNDSDPNGDNLRLTDVSYSGTTSVVTIVNDQIQINPLSAATNDRVEVVTYTVTDAHGASDTATLRVDIGNGTVTPEPTPPEPEPEPEPTPPAANEAPIAVDDAAQTGQNETFLVDVTNNDSDPDGTQLTLTSVSYDGNTSVVTIENGMIKVNPLRAASQDRVETITYTVTDADGATDTAVLEVTIGNPDDTPEPPVPPVDPPETSDATFALSTDQSPLSKATYDAATGELYLEFDYARLLDTQGAWSDARHIDAVTFDGTAYPIVIHADDGPRDSNGNYIFDEQTVDNVFTVNIGKGHDPANGTLSFGLSDREDGTGGLYTFELAEDTGDGPTGPTTPDPDPDPPVTQPVNAAPVATDDIATTPQNKTIFVDVLANDTDPEGGDLTLTDVSYDGSTSLVTIEGGMIKVNPLRVATDDRTETITYTVTDAEGASTTATLRVDIGNMTATPQPPVVIDDPDPDPEPTPTDDGADDSILDLFIADADSNETLLELTQGAQISADNIGDNFTFFATSDDTELDHVTLTFQGHTSKESIEPYALFGDRSGDFRKGLDLDPGTYELEVTGYGANQQVLEALNLSFELI